MQMRLFDPHTPPFLQKNGLHTHLLVSPLLTMRRPLLFTFPFKFATAVQLNSSM